MATKMPRDGCIKADDQIDYDRSFIDLTLLIFKPSYLVPFSQLFFKYEVGILHLVIGTSTFVVIMCSSPLRNTREHQTLYFFGTHASFDYCNVNSSYNARINAQSLVLQHHSNEMDRYAYGRG